MAFLPRTLRIALGGFIEEAIEGVEEIGQQVVKAHLGGDFSGFGDNQVDAIGKCFSERGDGVRGWDFAKEIEAFDLGFDLAMRHDY